MEYDLEDIFGYGFLPNLFSPKQMMSNQKLQCERSLKDQAPWYSEKSVPLNENCVVIIY